MEITFDPVNKDMIVKYENLEPCDHEHCLGHVLHSCEKCGRTTAIGTAEIRYLALLVT